MYLDNSNVKFIKSSGNRNPVPMEMITRVFDITELKKHINEENIDQYMKVMKINNKEMRSI